MLKFGIHDFINAQPIIASLKQMNDWVKLDIYINDRDKIISYLKKHKIQTRPVYGEINKTNIYYTDNILPNSNYVCTKGLFLPSYITLTNNEILYICRIIYIYILYICII